MSTSEDRHGYLLPAQGVMYLGTQQHRTAWHWHCSPRGRVVTGKGEKAGAELSLANVPASRKGENIDGLSSRLSLMASLPRVVVCSAFLSWHTVTGQKEVMKPGTESTALAQARPSHDTENGDSTLAALPWHLIK